ncbi:unnamed protein product [Schistocephalus solidus]|uniref:Estradiol 17-beta-dehydrogenase 12 n=1 Tax=Schistocephalus solidus TaxID=70667 RepID=A0A183SXD3_SCHSO|nr:unnamed protein product [Schistocephalus solidus]
MTSLWWTISLLPKLGFLYLLYCLLYSILKYTLGKSLFSKRKQLKTAGDWAVVTGAASGIGRGFSRELAKDGLNILLVDVNAEGVAEVARNIHEEFKVQTKTFIADLSDIGCYKGFKEAIDGLSSVACLVNNAGTASGMNEQFLDGEKCTFDSIAFVINLNVLGFTCATKAAIEKLCDDAAARRPFLINISSINALIKPRGLPIYSASKSYVKTMSEGLATLLATRGVRVQTYMPCAVATNLAQVAPIWPIIPSPEEYAASALDMLGVEENSCGYFFHDLHYVAFRVLLTARRLYDIWYIMFKGPEDSTKKE